MMERSGYEFDLLMGPLRSERRAWSVAAAATGVALVLGAVLVAVMPLKSTEVVTVLVDRHTGDVEKVVTVQPTGIEDEEAIKQALLVSYVSDREGFL
ncbi:MAG: type IV secretion system protein, partial [Paracoccaceae bacterium]|nr:type IV secretion system protein [Paracoccaceae bacterium]